MRAHLRLELKTKSGETVAVRQGCNSVLQSGANLLAQLFSGHSGAITHMAVGTSDAPEGEAFGTTALTGATLTPIAADEFSVDPPDPVTRFVRVRVRPTVSAAAPAGPIREAALLHAAARR